MPRLMKDEYNWPVYTREYSGQIAEMEKTAGDNGSEFLITDFELKENHIEFKNKLHGNWKEIYTAIHQTKPSSVFECGCGGLYHLKNIKKLFPNVDVHGCDLLDTQINFGKNKFNVEPEIMNNVRVLNFATPEATKDLSKYDFVYSHAVMLHLSWDNTKIFMKNMTKIANKNIFFIEGYKHEYEEVLKEIDEYNNWEISHPNYFVENSWLLTKK